MAKVPSRVLVIDASIARSAGDVSTHPTSRHCREFLLSVLEIGHHAAMTRPIQEEWNKHQSNFARRWRTAMVARKKLEFPTVTPEQSLERRLERVVSDEFIRAIMDKDRRLIEAALVTDKRVASLDDKVREHFRNHQIDLPEVRSICWVNPDKPDEKAIEWLEAGAPSDRRRCLSFQRRPAK